jgi:hypothetical protein
MVVALPNSAERMQDQSGKTQELAMTLTDLESTAVQTPSPSRLRYVEAQLRSDADAVLREIAYVLKLTQRVKQDILAIEDERSEFWG